MNHENLPRHIAERIVADFGANTEFALQELDKYRAEAASVGQEWQDYFAYVLSLPEPEGNTETAAFMRQPVTVAEVTQSPLTWEIEPVEVAPTPIEPMIVEPAVVEPVAASVESVLTAETQVVDRRKERKRFEGGLPSHSRGRGAAMGVGPA